jgi:hypothetical protein
MPSFYAALRTDPDLARRFKASEKEREMYERLNRMCKEVTQLVHDCQHGRLSAEALRTTLDAMQAEANALGYRLKTYRPPPPSNVTLAMFHRLVLHPEDVAEAERARAEAMNNLELQQGMTT